MNTNHTKLRILLFVLALLLLAPVLAHADTAVPDGINYQGLLTDASGKPVQPDGTYTLEFRLWSDPDTEDASALWGRRFDVTVVSGQFNVILNDAGTALAEGAEHRVKSLMDAFAEPKRYLGIKIANAPVTPQEGEAEAAEKATTITGEIKPRQAILSAPYAIQAENGVPVGTIVSYFGTSEPKGWLFCNGQSLTDPAHPEYADLRAQIGDTVPDLRGFFIRGLGGSSESMNEVQDDTTAIPDETPFRTDSTGAHKHVTVVWGSTMQNKFGTRDLGAHPGAYGNAGFNDSTYNGPQTSSDGTHGHTILGGDAETRPINKAFNYIIKY